MRPRRDQGAAGHLRYLHLFLCSKCRVLELQQGHGQLPEHGEPHIRTEVNILLSVSHSILENPLYHLISFGYERCAGEDRLLQCEFNGREVQHNIPNTPKEAFDSMFYKSWMSARVSNLRTF